MIWILRQTALDTGILRAILQTPPEVRDLLSYLIQEAQYFPLTLGRAAKEITMAQSLNQPNPPTILLSIRGGRRAR